jgi:hypothetical protein
MEHEYLVSYGLLGDFGRFRPAASLTCCRGDRVIVRTPRGLELGEVLRDATPRHAHFLPNTTVGPLLRHATDEDERLLETLRGKSGQLCESAARQAAALALPLAVLDAEHLLDEHAVLHFVRWQECDLRPLVSGLSTEFDVGVLLQDLTRADTPEEEGHGCGSCGDGHCGSGGCGSGGCGSCGSATSEEVRSHFAGLREQMAARNRVPLV